MELNLKELQKKYSMNLRGVIHVGAHFGQEYSDYNDCGAKQIIFFEPTPESFRVLNNTFKNYDNVICENLAVGSETGDTEMFVETANVGMSNSLLQPKKHLEQYPHIKFENKILVSVTTLDEYKRNNEDYNLLVLDVQGYELEVLKGGEKSLKDFDFIITEVNRDELYLDCVQVETLDYFLLQHNFKRVETNWCGGTFGDALYIKEK